MSGALSELGNILTMPSPSHPWAKAPQVAGHRAPHYRQNTPSAHGEEPPL